MKWFDAHCHLQIEPSRGVAEPVEPVDYLARARAQAVEKLVCVGTDPESSLRAAEIAAEADQHVYCTVGLHPHDASQGVDNLIATLDRCITIADKKVVGIGECGLDYFYEYSGRNKQKEAFAFQIDLAKEYNKTLVIHTRDAWPDTLDILRTEGAPPRTVVHCFTGGPEEARNSLDLGLYLSFSGIVTFPKSTEVQVAAQICPLDRMTIETDTPFLTPVPYRGKPNEPAFVGVIGKYLSELKGVAVEDFAERIFVSTCELFDLQWP